MVVVGASRGGFTALTTILSGLPAGFPLPLAIVQHRARTQAHLLPQLLGAGSALPVEEAEDKLPIMPGKVYLAPADYHLLVEEDYFTLSTEGPVSYARPSIDVLFESAAYSYGSDVIGIILTGANRDGAYGAALLKRKGGRLLVQEPSSAESAVMPLAAMQAHPDWILPLAAIAPFLANFCVGSECG